MFSQNLRIIPTFALSVSLVIHGSLYGILSMGKPYSFERIPIFIEVVHAEKIKTEDPPKPIEKPVVKRLSLSPPKTVPLLPPVPEPERKEEKPAPLPPVNPLQVAEDTGAKEADPILVPSAQKMPSIPGAPPAAVDQPMAGKKGNLGTGGVGTGLEEGATMGPVNKTLGEETGPAFKKKVMPLYPAYARRLHREGSVLLEVLIDRDGIPRGISFLKRAGFGFDEAAREAILKSRFYPAMEKGMPILCLVRIPIRFELTD